MKSYRGEHIIDWIGYADVLELYFEDVTNLQKGITLLNDTFDHYHLQINVSRTKTMIANYRYINSNEETYPENIVKLCDEDVENVKVFRYLGDDIKFNQPSTGDTEIGLTSVAENKFSQIARTLCNTNTILEVMVRSRLTYSCQTWNINQEQMNRVNSTYVNMLRKMIRDRSLQTKNGN